MKSPKSNLENNLEKIIETADDLLHERKAADALKMLLGVSEITKKAPSQLRYRYLEVLGDAYSENNMESKAIKCYEKALHMKNVEIDEPFLYYNLGSSYAELGDEKKGILYLQKALISEKERLYLLNILSQLTTYYQNENKYGKAIETARRLIQEFYPPTNELENERVQMAYLGLAANYWKIGNEDSADVFHDKLVTNPKTKSWILARAYGIRGHRHFEKKKYEKAAEDYSKAIDYASLSSSSEDLNSIAIWREWMEKAKSRL